MRRIGLSKGVLCSNRRRLGGKASGIFFGQVAVRAVLQYNFSVTIPALLTQRRRQRRQRSNPALIGGLGMSGFLSVAAALIFFTAGGLYIWVVSDLPSLENIPALIQTSDGRLREPSKIYDRSGQNLLYTLQHPGAAGSQFLTAEPGNTNSIPLPLVEATLAAIQPDFWDDTGYGLQIAASEENPTLAEILVSELLLYDESPSIRRRLRQELLAGQVLRTHGNSKVLEWFLNSRNYGPLVYGADAASRAYFGTPASEISFAQAAWLTALAEMPGINPYNPPARLLERQQAILEGMIIQNRLPLDLADQARTEKIVLQGLEGEPGPAPGLVSLAVQQAEAALGSRAVTRGSLRILTTLDSRLQTELVCTTAAQIERLENREAGADEDCQAGRLLPSLALDTPAPAGSLSGAALLLDARSGQIRAMIGDSAQVHQTGTLLAPFVYLAAFSRGFTPASLFWDIPIANETVAAQAYHGPLRLRTALANNYAGPALQLLNQLGNPSIQQITDEFGLTEEAATFTASLDGAQNRPILVGGTSTLLDTTQAFNILANGGVAVGQRITRPGGIQSSGIENEEALRPTAVLMVFDSHGQVILDWSLPTTRPVASVALAYLVNHILSDEAARWPSLGHPNPLEIGRPAAAQIGYSPDYTNGWAIGYTPYLTQAVWLGAVENGPLTSVNDLAVLPEAAAGIWHALMQYASRDLPSDMWPVPAGVASLSVCAASGLLPTAACPSMVSEMFLNGTEPVQADNLYRSFQINRDNGLRATVFTPPELIEERTFMVVPAEAVEWARQTGLPLPPDSYDIIYNRLANPDAQINSPGIFDHVHGLIRVRGSAGGSGFKYYRLLVGQGLNPQSWTQLGEDVTRAVQNGVLGEWDTSQMQGLYAIQLMVVGENQKLESAVTQVTIDNEPPQVSLRAEPNILQTRSIVLHAEASDNLELTRVEFYVDDTLAGSLTRAPFSLSWEGRAGTHEVRAVAYDLAGNTSSASVSITLK